MSPVRRTEVGLDHPFELSEEAEAAGQVALPEGVLSCPACGYAGLHVLTVEARQPPVGRDDGGAALEFLCAGGHRFRWEVTAHEGQVVASIEDVAEVPEEELPVEHIDL